MFYYSQTNNNRYLRILLNFNWDVKFTVRWYYFNKSKWQPTIPDSFGSSSTKLVNHYQIKCKNKTHGVWVL